MNKKLSVSISLSIFAALALQSMPVFACSFDSMPYFTYTSHPDLPLQKYAAGQLGILQPGYARSYLLNAYRYLSNAPLSADEQADILSLWNARLTATDFSCQSDASSWLKARTAVPGAAKVESIASERSISKDDQWQTYCNCQTPAFETASKTLKALIEKFGVGSPAVKDWLKAQDEVFSNCGVPPYSDKPLPTVIPAALPATADLPLQQDRAYQIAAANFYSQNFDDATKQFEAIAVDASSPWKQIAGYLAVRSMIRQASLSKELNKPLLLAADQKLKVLMADPAYATMSDDLTDLASFIAVRLTPEQHLENLATGKFTQQRVAEITKTIDTLTEQGSDGQQVTDYSKLPASVKKPDIIDWVMTFQSSDAAGKSHAIAQWKQTHSIPWLIAALAVVDEKDPEAAAILAASTGAESGPARWSIFYYANELKLAKGSVDSVRVALDKVLNSPPADLDQGSLNQLKEQRLALARNIDEFVRFGVQAPLSICSNGGTAEVPDDVEGIIKGSKTTKDTPEFVAQAAAVMDSKLPLSLLKKLANYKPLQTDLRNNVAWTSWVRAILIGDDASARELAPIAKALNKAKSKLFDAYLAATTPEARKFAAVNLMLHYSSAVPNVAWGPLQEDDYGDASGWWWAARPTLSMIQMGYDSSKTAEPFDPDFVDAAQKAQAKREVAKLDTVEAAPNYFAKIVLPYAKAHPKDPAVPEALHWLVKATRYGNTDEATKVFSKQAFTLLHNNYKTSPWTKQTPYYY